MHAFSLVPASGPRQIRRNACLTDRLREPSEESAPRLAYSTEGDEQGCPRSALSYAWPNFACLGGGLS